MLAGMSHVTILTIVCFRVFLVLFTTFLFFSGSFETHFLEILFAGGSSSTSKDLFLEAVNTISSGVSEEGSVVDATIEKIQGLLFQKNQKRKEKS